MKIGINGLLLGGAMSGANRRIINLASSALMLDHEVIVYASRWSPPRIPTHPKLTVKILPLPTKPIILRAASEQTALPYLSDQDHLDFLECSHFPVPKMKKTPLAITIHDLRHIAKPEFSSYAKQKWAKEVYQSAMDRARLVCVPSAFTKEELCKHLRIEPQKIRVIPNAADHLIQPEYIIATKHREPVFLYIGHLEPRKNLITLVQAFARFKSKDFPHLLQIVGTAKGSYAKRILQLARNLDIEDSVEWITDVEDEVLPILYSKAQLFVFPSFYEGFGIPLLEAMRCGTPALVSRIPALQEIGGSACEYADPQNVDEWANKLETLALNEGRRDELAQRGLQHEKQFSWIQSGEKMLEAYTTTLAS